MPSPAPLIRDVFGPPDVVTGNGLAWHIIRTPLQADLATHAGDTAIGFFWKMSQDDAERLGIPDNHVWAILVDADDRAVVSMASLKTGETNSRPEKLADCHVTGYRNADVFREFEAEIRAFCDQMSLVCEPNWMGGTVKPEDDPEP